MISEMSTFQFFPNLGPREGEGHQKPIFSQIQNRPHYPLGVGGGQENYGLFPQFCGIFSLEYFPKY